LSSDPAKAAAIAAAAEAAASSSKSTTPCGSPTPISHHGRRQFLMASLKKQRSKSHANIAPLPYKLLQQHQRDSCDAKDAKRSFDNPEQEILAFQRELQNLPDFDLSENAGPHEVADIIAGTCLPFTLTTR
jgi:hypothetical protein